MPYNCVVLVKQVPDTKGITVKAMNDDGTVNRGALPAIFNPEDLNALEAALQVKDIHGGSVTVITMGPPWACHVLRDALYRGADRAILITDRRAAASDTLATSYILSCAVRKQGSVDMVFCGRQAIDGDTAQVGPQLAEKLDMPQITYMEEMPSLSNGQVQIRRNVGNGWELVESSLPVLITVVGTANVPRPPGARRIMKYKRARGPAEIQAELSQQHPENSADQINALVEKRTIQLHDADLLIQQWDLDAIAADLAWCGRSGSPTKVHRIQSVVLRGCGYKQFEPNDQGVVSLVRELIEERTLG